jgi:hypothetical protein
VKTTRSVKTKEIAQEGETAYRNNEQLNDFGRTVKKTKMQYLSRQARELSGKISSMGQIKLAFIGIFTLPS